MEQNLPLYITDNLNAGKPLRPYQAEGLMCLVARYGEWLTDEKRNQLHLLYHMATGSGKTIMMAGAMLYLYACGYSNFLFFVNSTNIIEKTKDNFLNRRSGKYLFNEHITIGGRRIEVCEVDNFQQSLPGRINICFSTVQGLHSALGNPQEGGISSHDLSLGKIVILADEAHHINAATKSGAQASDTISWEGTAQRILLSHPHNIMLEYTATANINHPLIAQKYHNKLAFSYTLREFSAQGYSKNVQTLAAEGTPFQRTIMALVLSQYRRKLLESRGISIKPVVLIKSKTIKESRDYKLSFNQQLRAMDGSILQSIIGNNSQPPIRHALEYMASQGISMDNLCQELRVDFNEERQIQVDSMDDSCENQLAVNSLEEAGNPYRLIFAVDKLNEGWDVLNLYDIVRLYDTRTQSKSTTMQEAQLIGRGARYCPFADGDMPAHKRKYDNQPQNPMRICEQLYYHALRNPQYINDLNSALQEIGILEEGNRKTALPRKPHSPAEKAARAIREAHTPGKYHPISLVGTRTLREAISRIDFYKFSNLKEYFPNLESISQFMEGADYLGGVDSGIKLESPSPATLSQDEKLNLAMDVLYKVQSRIIR